MKLNALQARRAALAKEIAKEQPVVQPKVEAIKEEPTKPVRTALVTLEEPKAQESITAVEQTEVIAKPVEVAVQETVQAPAASNGNKKKKTV